MDIKGIMLNEKKHPTNPQRFLTVLFYLSNTFEMEARLVGCQGLGMGRWPGWRRCGYTRATRGILVVTELFCVFTGGGYTILHM